MRRSLLGCVLALAGALVNCPTAIGQFYQQRGSTSPALQGGVNHISAQPSAAQAASEAASAEALRRHNASAGGPQRWPVGTHISARAPAQPANAADAKVPAAASNQNAPNQNAPPNQNGVPNQNGGWRQHHHPQQRNDNGWLFWGAYPLVWTPGYTPAFGVYGPGYPFMQQGFSVLPQGTAPAAAAPLDPPRNDPRNDPAPAASAKPKVRVTSAEWKAKAGRYIGYGDTNFGKQSYLAAVERYRTATQMAPDVAETYFRQAFALVALGQYESAAKTFRRGLRVRSDWSDSPFRLDQIYGDDQIAKTAHVENLAKAVEANPLDAELLLVLGMQIYFDGQPQRAEVFFARVAQLGGNADKLLDDFLPQPGPAGAGKPDDAQPAGKKIVF